MTVALVIGLAAPAVGVLVAVALPRRPAGPIVAGFVGVGAAAWLAVLAAGGVRAGRFDAPPLVAAAALGAGLLALPVWRWRHLEATLPPALAAGALVAGLTLGLNSGRSGVLAAAIGVTALFVIVADASLDAAVAGAAVTGVAWTVVGFAIASRHANTWTLPGALDASRVVRAGSLPAAAALAALAGCALLTVAGSIRNRPTDAILVVAATALAIRIGGAVAGAGAGTAIGRYVAWTAVTLAALAAIAAAAGRPALPLALLALAAAIGPTAAAAGACLLGTAAVLCVLDSHPVAAVTGVPGFVALLSGARATPGGASAALAAAATVAAIVMATQVRRRDAHAGGGASSPARAPSGVTLAVVVLGAWLVTVPRAWVWIGRSAFGAYDRGAAVALASGLLVVTASACRSFRDAARPQRRV